MNIGMIHFKVGGTDGVSLEMDKWKLVLEEMGHRVYYCAGDLGTVEGTLIEEIFHHREDAHRLNVNTFGQLKDYPNEAAYRAELYGKADVIELKLRAWVEDKKIDFLIPENVWSVGASLGRHCRDKRDARPTDSRPCPQPRLLLGAPRRGGPHLCYRHRVCSEVPAAT